MVPVVLLQAAGCSAFVRSRGRCVCARRSRTAAAAACLQPPASPPPLTTTTTLPRLFCARRLRTLYKTLKFLHGKGRYQKKKLEVGMITDSRWLMIPLISAERAWAQAMEIKKDNEDRPLPHKRHHSIRRLTKASAWAAELARFAAGARSSVVRLSCACWVGWGGVGGCAHPPAATCPHPLEAAH